MEASAQKAHAFLCPEFILNSFKPISVVALMDNHTIYVKAGHLS